MSCIPSPTDRRYLDGFIDFLLCRASLPSKVIADEKALVVNETAPLLGRMPVGPDGTASGDSLTSTKSLAKSFPMHRGSEEESMVQPILPTYTGISVTTDEDVHVLLNAVTCGKLQLVKQRPSKDQQMSLVKSGHCFVFDELESKILRWTDSRKWGQKRVHGKFTVCSESSTSSTEPRFIKHTYRVKRDNSCYHVVAYSHEQDSLTPASKDQGLLQLSSGADERRPPIRRGDGTAGADVGAAYPNPYAGSSSAHANVPIRDNHNSMDPNLNYPWTSFPQTIFHSPSEHDERADMARDEHAFSAKSHPNSEYFNAFLTACPHSWRIPTSLTEGRQFFLQRFFTRVASFHATPDQTCFAAMETFAFEYQGTPSVLAFLAVLREPFDIYRPLQNMDGATKCRTQLIFDFTILPVSALNTEEPFTWLAIQTLGSYFRSERLKRAAWALGQLPPGSHCPDSVSFKWVRQTWTREQLRSGSRHVVDLVPGANTQRWAPLRRLKTRLYHPANLALNSELVAVLDEKLRLACRQSLQEWCIALIWQLLTRPQDAGRLCQAYTDYMVQTTELQVNCLSQTGYVEALHTCSRSPCDHTVPSLADIKTELHQTLQSLTGSLVGSLQRGQLMLYSYLDVAQFAATLGDLCYWLQGSYVLLSPAERLHYDSLCRTGLNTLRAELGAKVGGGPILIWNYLPEDVQSWAAKQRELMESDAY